MFERISIKNFKAFSNWQEVELAPITLIYGPNSSGKSSIIHAIMLLKQSLTRPNVQGGLVSNGEYVDLGDYSSMVNGHELSRSMSFKFTYLPVRKTGAYDAGFDVFGVARKRSYELEYSYYDGGAEEKGFSYLNRMALTVSNVENGGRVFKTDVVCALVRDIDLAKDEIRQLEERLSVANDRDKRQLEDKIASEKMKLASKKISAAKKYNFYGDAWKDALDYLMALPRQGKLKSENREIVDSIHFRGDLNYATPSMAVLSGKAVGNYVDGYAQLNFAMESLANNLKGKFGSVTYLGPLRSHPSRFYAPKADQNDSVGKQGENVARFLYEKPEITDEINSWFKQFEVPYELSSESIGTAVTGPVICLQLKDRRTGVIVGPSDVGFGIGQMLPIIVEGLVRDNSVICVEQPEIHLHPRLQAHIANFLVDTCNKNQWVIETHSEALMLRLQKLISEGGLAPDKVNILYVQSGEGGAEIHRIRLDEDGDFIDAWPDGFFEERLKEKKRRS